MNYKGHKSNVIFNLSNNLFTLPGKRPDDGLQEAKLTEKLNRWENILTAEVMNELLHLPADTVLIPFLKRLGVQTGSTDCDDVLHTGILDKDSGYFKPNFVSHKDGYSVQPDTTVVLKDCVIYFEFKNPFPAPSSNKHSIRDLGRQTLLAYKHMRDYGVENYKIILISNSAQKVFIEKEGLVNPGDVVARYFTEREDKWLENEHVKELENRVDMEKLSDSFIVLNWIDIFNHAISTVEEAADRYDDKNIRAMILNSLESLKWFRARREVYFSKYRASV
ncbi:MAG: hypothetical protein ACM3S4_08925 [Burkholderiales bacterium]